MKPRHYLLMLVVLSLGLSMGYSIGSNGQKQLTARKIQILEKHLARFENPQVFKICMETSKITGAPLYQVLTGKIYPYTNN